MKHQALTWTIIFYIGTFCTLILSFIDPWYTIDFAINDLDPVTLVEDDLWTSLEYFTDAKCNGFWIFCLWFFAVVFPLLKMVTQGFSIYVMSCVVEGAPFYQENSMSPELRSKLIRASRYETFTIGTIFYKLSEVYVYIGIFLAVIGTLTFTSADDGVKYYLTAPIKNGSWYYITAHVLSLTMVDMFIYLHLELDNEQSHVHAALERASGEEEDEVNHYQIIPSVANIDDDVNTASFVIAVTEDNNPLNDQSLTTTDQLIDNSSAKMIPESAEKLRLKGSCGGDSIVPFNFALSWTAICTRETLMNTLLLLILSTGISILSVPIIRFQYEGIESLILDPEYVSNDYTVYGFIRTLYDITNDLDGYSVAVIFYVFVLFDILLVALCVLLLAASLEYPKMGYASKHTMYETLIYTYPWMNIESFTLSVIIFAGTAEPLVSK